MNSWGDRAGDGGRLEGVRPPPVPARARTIAQRAHAPFVAICVVTLIAFVVRYDDVAAGGVIFSINRLVTTIVCFIGVRATRRAVRREWALIGLASVLWCVADVVGAVGTAAHGGVITFTGLLTLVASAGYALSAIGIIGLVRIEGISRGTTVLIESAVASISYLTICWLLAGRAVPGIVPRSISMMSWVSPVGGVLAIASAVVLLSSRAGHDPSSRFLAFSCFCGILGDLLFTGFDSGHLPWARPAFSLAYMLQYMAIAAGALRAGHSLGASNVHTVSFAGLAALMGATAAPALTLALDSMVTGYSPDRVHVGVVAVATVAMVTLTTERIRRVVRQVEHQALELEARARTDELTRLPNRRAGQRMLTTAIADAHGSDLAVAIIDIDHFKAYNDSFGHLQGDRLLRAAGMAWTSALGHHGSIYRHGGEEFVVILPEATQSEAHAALARMRAATPRGQSFSAGLVMLRPGDDTLSLLARADASLYAAKAAGRGRTMLSA